MKLRWRRRDRGHQEASYGDVWYRVHHDVDCDRGVGRQRSAWEAEYRGPDADPGEWEDLDYSSTMAGAKVICQIHADNNPRSIGAAAQFKPEFQ